MATNDGNHIPLRTSLVLASLLVVVLTFSCFVSIFSNNSVSLFTLGTSDTVVVNNETGLRNAVNNAQTGKATIIAFDKDITLKSTLTISANKDITLTSNKASGFYKLIGAKDKSTVIVDENGLLKLDGIIVTHTNFEGSKFGGGVFVEASGRLIMYSGEISGNAAVGGRSQSQQSAGGGVFILGVFELHGGKISNNIAYENYDGNTQSGGYGGGVFVSGNGSFSMFGGEISGNRAEKVGGGVSNGGTFTMSGGKIVGNTAHLNGDGVDNAGVFTMSGGEISGNTEGGVRNYESFTMSGGQIVNNHANAWGGGVTNSGTFKKLGGVISGNTPVDVYPSDGSDSSSGEGSSNGNNGSSNGDREPADNDEMFVDGFSLKNVVFLVGVAVVVVGVVIAVLLFYRTNRI
jgi:hypothetical protein